MTSARAALAILLLATACSAPPHKAEPALPAPSTAPDMARDAAPDTTPGPAPGFDTPDAAPDLSVAPGFDTPDSSPDSAQQGPPATPRQLLDDRARRGPRDLVITAFGDVSQPTPSWPAQTNQLKGKVFEPTLPYIQSADLAFLNLENPISEASPKVKKEFSFTSHPDRLSWYIEAGFNLFSLSNNHIGDADQEGIDDTLRYLVEWSTKLNKQIWWAGAATTYADAEAPTIFKVPNKDLTVAFFSTGNSRHPHVSKYWSEAISKRIKQARTEADLVIISVHAGKEYIHVPEEDLQRRYRAWIDAGADLVIGHHPHVVRPAEAYKNAFILHSLGNYVFMSRTYRHRDFRAKMYGLMARVVVQDGKISGAELVPLWVNNSEPWRLDSGELLPNANFVPRPLSGPFADTFFDDFKGWSLAAGVHPPERTADTGWLPVPATSPNPARQALSSPQPMPKPKPAPKKGKKGKKATKKKGKR
jgi:poly-gamma-glutamate synthesis protein (capsule biosynthesis protein)